MQISGSRYDAESLISLKEVPDWLPRRHGRRLHYSTVFRWATKGARGKKLESFLVGGVRYTTAAALEQFIGRPPSGATIDVEIVDVDRLLDAEGV